MKNIIIAFCMLVATCANAQILQKHTNFGDQFYRLQADSSLGIPKDTFALKISQNQLPHLATNNGSPYIWSVAAQRWVLLGGGSGGSYTGAAPANVNGSVISVDTAKHNAALATFSDVAKKLNTTDTTDIRLQPIAGLNMRIDGQYPHLTFSVIGGGSGGGIVYTGLPPIYVTGTVISGDTAKHNTALATYSDNQAAVAQGNANAIAIQQRMDSLQLIGQDIYARKGNVFVKQFTLPASSTQVLDVTYSASLNQTDFATPSTITDIKRIIVFRNGAENQITQINSTTIRLPRSADASDRIKIIQFN